MFFGIYSLFLVYKATCLISDLLNFARCAENTDLKTQQHLKSLNYKAKTSVCKEILESVMCSLFVLSKYALISDVTKGQVQPAALSVQKKPFFFSSWKSLCLATFAPKKNPQSSARVQRQVERKRKIVFFCFFFCSCALVRFSPPGRRGTSLWQPQGCSCGMRRRQFHQALVWNKSGLSTVTTGELSAGADHRSGKIYIPLGSVFPSKCVIQQCCTIHYIPTAIISPGIMTFLVVHIHW